MYSWTYQKKKKKRLSFIFPGELNYISLHPVVWINKQSLTNFRLAAVLAGRTFAWKGSANTALTSSHFLLPLTSLPLGLPTSTLPPCWSLSCFLVSSVAFFLETSSFPHPYFNYSPLPNCVLLHSDEEVVSIKFVFGDWGLIAQGCGINNIF